MTQVNYDVAQSTDDAGDIGSLSITFDDNDVYYWLATSDSGTATTSGWRFQSVAVPQGATIDSASFTLSTWNIKGFGNSVSTCWGVDADDLDTWSSGANRPKDATKTTASDTMTLKGGSDISNGVYVARSFDVTTIVQEIVDRGGWSSGADMGFICTTGAGHGLGNTLRAFTYDAYGGGAYPYPHLTINYTSAAGTNFQINIGDSWHAVEGMQINIGDTWKAAAGAQVNIGDAWKTIF